MDRGTPTVLSRRRFDVDEYHRMARAGVLTEDDRVELLDGEIVEMGALGSRHISCVARLHRAFVEALGDRAFVTSQGAVRLGRYSEPHPDVAVLRPRADDYAGNIAGPEDTLLLVEVADTSLTYDRDVKLPLYAAAGIREVWIVDLTARVVQVCREPRQAAYRVQSRLERGTLSPLAFPELELETGQILPPSS